MINTSRSRLLESFLGGDHRASSSFDMWAVVALGGDDVVVGM